MPRDQMLAQGEPRVKQVNLRLTPTEENAISFLSEFHDSPRGEIVRRYFAIDSLVKDALELRAGVGRITRIPA